MSRLGNSWLGLHFHEGKCTNGHDFETTYSESNGIERIPPFNTDWPRVNRLKWTSDLPLAWYPFREEKWTRNENTFARKCGHRPKRHQANENSVFTKLWARPAKMGHLRLGGRLAEERLELHWDTTELVLDRNNMREGGGRVLGFSLTKRGETFGRHHSQQRRENTWCCLRRWLLTRIICVKVYMR